MSIDTMVEMDARRTRPATAVRFSPRRPDPPAREVFEHVYRRNIGALTRYFARRCREPQTVADLTSETVVRAVTGFAGYDPARGSDRAWLFGIAAHVFARHCEQTANGRDALTRLHGRRPLAPDEIEELTERIDAERAGAALLQRFAGLPDHEREVVELVDLEELTCREAARALGISHVAARQRLSRARSRLRKGVVGR